jgi:hypothetical protein
MGRRAFPPAFFAAFHSAKFIISICVLPSGGGVEGYTDLQGETVKPESGRKVKPTGGISMKL